MLAVGMSDWTHSRQPGLSPEIAFKQALALQNQGNLAGAEKLYRALLKSDPTNFATLYNLAGVLWTAERFDDAARMLRKALSQKPNSAEAHTLLASVLRSLERYDEALERAKRAITLNPGFAEAHDNLAQTLAELGRYQEALPAQLRAIELAPAQARYYFHLGQLRKWRAGDPHLAALEALRRKQAALPIDEQIYLHFALGKAYSDCGDIARGFRCQIEGGALKRRTFRYDEAASLDQLDALTRALDSAWMQRHRDIGDSSSQPVFILGMPRSGSTLIEQILVSHPKIRTIGERSNFSGALAQIAESTAHKGSIVEQAAQWPDAEFHRLGSRYLETARRQAGETSERICDKTPWNFRYVGLIHAALPNARIIHTQRNSIDTCLSIFSILFRGSSQPYAYDLAELGRYYRGYEKAMAHWRSVLPAGIMLDVRYEDIVDDVEHQARRIVAHCGLEWDDACLSFHETARAVRTASQAQVRKPIYRDSVGRARPPEDMLRPLLDALGL
jgi:Tfp pilus assembly protein PilF